MNPPAGGSYGLVGKGTGRTPTNLGTDSQNQENETTRHWDSVSSAAPGTVRSKGKAGPSPTQRGAALRRMASLDLTRLTPLKGNAGIWAREALQRAQATGEFPDDELWAARDAGLENVLRTAAPSPMKAVLEAALSAL